jgi:hypothetical protein
MAFVDFVTFDKEYPEFGISRHTILQSKSLHADDGSFTISADGKLIEHLRRREIDPGRLDPVTQEPRYRHVRVGDQVIDYHGDILLYGPASARGSGALVARFTHGRLATARRGIPGCQSHPPRGAWRQVIGRRGFLPTETVAGCTTPRRRCRPRHFTLAYISFTSLETKSRAP